MFDTRNLSRQQNFILFEAKNKSSLDIPKKNNMWNHDKVYNSIQINIVSLVEYQ